ncbi:hypothetical protein V8E36_002020 [Tilletia maclaganii]
MATAKWVEVARKEGLSTSILQQMVLLNHAIINDPQWRTHAQDRMEWHAVQRGEWSNRMHSDGALFHLHALQDKHYDAIQEVRTRATVMVARGEASSALAVAQHQRGGAGNAGPSRSSSRHDSFRPAGGAGSVAQPRQAQHNTRSSSGLACLRCGSRHPHTPQRCFPTSRVDGSPLVVESADGGRGLQFKDNRDPVCIPFNTYGCKGRCTVGVHRCSSCGRHNQHGHQQCPRAPHLA